MLFSDGCCVSCKEANCMDTMVHQPQRACVLVVLSVQAVKQRRASLPSGSCSTSLPFCLAMQRNIYFSLVQNVYAFLMDLYVMNPAYQLFMFFFFFFFLPSQERPNKEKKPSQVQEPLQEEADNRKW